MSVDPDIYDKVSRVQEKVSDLELSMTKKLGEVEATVRVVKHDNANTQQMVAGLTSRLDRFEASFKEEVKDFRQEVAKEFRAILAEISTNQTSTASKFSFYAGIAATGTFIISASGVIIAFAAKFMGSH